MPSRAFLIVSFLLLSCSPPAHAQSRSAAPLMVGNQGMDGPATVENPLIASNQSFIETAWCQQHTCVLRTKQVANDGYRLPPPQRLVAYTYATRAGTVKIWRLDTTGQVLKVLFRPPTRTWNMQTIRPLFSLVTGRDVSLVALKQCAAQTSAWRTLSKDSPPAPASGGQNVTFSMNCEVDSSSLPALTVVASAPATRPKTFTGTTQQQAPRTPAASNGLEPFRRNSVACIDKGILTELVTLSTRNAQLANIYMYSAVDVGACRIFDQGERVVLVNAGFFSAMWQVMAVDTMQKYWTTPFRAGRG